MINAFSYCRADGAIRYLDHTVLSPPDEAMLWLQDVLGLQSMTVWSSLLCCSMVATALCNYKLHHDSVCFPRPPYLRKSIVLITLSVACGVSQKLPRPIVQKRCFYNLLAFRHVLSTIQNMTLLFFDMTCIRNPTGIVIHGLFALGEPIYFRSISCVGTVEGTLH